MADMDFFYNDVRIQVSVAFLIGALMHECIGCSCTCAEADQATWMRILYVYVCIIFHLHQEDIPAAVFVPVRSNIEYQTGPHYRASNSCA